MIALALLFAAADVRVAHVVVALADNDNQGIVKVPKKIGNGQDPAANLYWGARYGVKYHFGHDTGWKSESHTSTLPAAVLERVVFRVDARTYVVADAYDGRFIDDAMMQTLRYLAGEITDAVPLKSGVRLHAGAGAELVAYVGHDGLMDRALVSPPSTRKDDRVRAAIYLACASKQYFGPLLQPLGAHQLLMTTNLMAPEAYVLSAALNAHWKNADVHLAAAKAYNEYQKCGLGGAKRLFVTSPKPDTR